jgi:ectoine hydroxylase-related dioxygenase (phytanoyl-CoA dioxygenase family)
MTRSLQIICSVAAVQATLPDLDDLYDVPQVAIDGFQRDGHTVLRTVCSPEEIEAYRPVIHDAAIAHNRETRPIEERDTYGKAFLQVPNLWRRDEGVARFVLAKRFAKIAADLLGVEGVRLYHDQALFKEAGGGRTPWHQDQYYWPLDTEKTITMWMPLVNVSAEIGSMTFASGSQRHGYLGSYAISDESDAEFTRMVAEKGLPLDTHGAVAAGDATFHTGWMLHSAPANPTGTLRAVMTIIWYADGAHVTAPNSPAQDFDRQLWLGGLEPGDLANGPKNPVVWP